MTQHLWYDWADPRCPYVAIQWNNSEGCWAERPEDICICGKKYGAAPFAGNPTGKAGLEQNRRLHETPLVTILLSSNSSCVLFVICRLFQSLRGSFEELRCGNSGREASERFGHERQRRPAAELPVWDREKRSVLSGAKPRGRSTTCDPDISGSIGGQSHPQPTHTHPCTARLFWPRWLRKFHGKDDPWAKALLGAVNWSNRAMFLLLLRRCFINKTSGLLSEPAPIYIQSWKLFIRCILIWCIFIRYSRCQLSVCLKTAMSCMATILVFHSRNWHDRVYPNTYCNGYLGLLSVYCDEGYLWLLPSPDSLSSLLSTLLLAFPPQQHGGPSLPSTPTWRSSKNTSDNASYCIFGFSSFF